MTRTKDIQEALRNEYLRVHEEAQALYVLQPKGKVRKLRRAAVASTVIAVSLASFIGFRAFRVEPYHVSSMALANAYVASDYTGCIRAMEKMSIRRMDPTQRYMLANAYVASDYTGCIRAMEKMSIRRMDPTQRYMLATAYVRLESLDAEQKENVLATLSLKDSSLRAEYWIHLGRWETDEAIDIAMQLADGQLEIYAYLKERARLEADTAMSGEEKQAAVDAVESRIEDLREKYGPHPGPMVRRIPTAREAERPLPCRTIPSRRGPGRRAARRERPGSLRERGHRRKGGEGIGRKSIWRDLVRKAPVFHDRRAEG